MRLHGTSGQFDTLASMAEAWLTKRELATELKISTRTIERLRLPAMRVGGQNRYRRSEVEAFLLGGSSTTSDVIKLEVHRR